ncbi:hypothetical protein EON66_02660 [archaeon]|nr:MAG: hypothetical protein EON66_02660 [archaeon]
MLTREQVPFECALRGRERAAEGGRAPPLPQPFSSTSLSAATQPAAHLHELIAVEEGAHLSLFVAVSFPLIRVFISAPRV